MGWSDEGPSGKDEDIKAVIPDHSYATSFKEVINYCRKNGEFNGGSVPKTVGPRRSSRLCAARITTSPWSARQTRLGEWGTHCAEYFVVVRVIAAMFPAPWQTVKSAQTSHQRMKEQKERQPGGFAQRSSQDVPILRSITPLISLSLRLRGSSLRCALRSFTNLEPSRAIYLSEFWQTSEYTLTPARLRRSLRFGLHWPGSAVSCSPPVYY